MSNIMNINMEWCSMTTEECENIILCLCNHITGEDYALDYNDTFANFTFYFFNNANHCITRKLTIRLIYDLHANTYVWQAYNVTAAFPRLCQDQCFVGKHNMIAELIVLLNRLGFSTPPQMW